MQGAVNDWVVVDDPTREVPEGVVFEGVEHVRAVAALARRGVTLLPVDASAIDGGALGGWFKRSWGEGVELVGMRGARCCPLALQVDPGREFLHLAVRLVPARSTAKPRGTVRLVPDPSGASAGFSGGLSALDADVDATKVDLDAPDARGGWTLRRVYRVSCSLRGTMLFQLWGVADGVRVAWAALSQARVGKV